MPGLVSISSGLHIAPKLEWLSFYNCPNLKNPLVEELYSSDLKEIKGERSWWEALEWSNGRPIFQFFLVYIIMLGIKVL
jgi:disease resistance protein RPS2